MPSTTPFSHPAPPRLHELSTPDLAGVAARLDEVADELTLQSRLARAGYMRVVWDDEARQALDRRLDAIDHELARIVAGLRDHSAALRRELSGSAP